MFEKEDRVLVGVSGGADSICLLHSLMKLGEEHGWKVYGAHLNHCFRGEEADRDQVFIREFCSKWGIELFEKKIDVNSYAKKFGLSSEDAGRAVRYEMFREAESFFSCNKLAVAQNKNDQAETVLMNLMRGAGLDGLKGIAYKRGNIFRPLLDFDRNEIENYCGINGIDFVVDSTNLMPIYSRNKVRLQLIPYIKENFNSNIIETISRMSKNINEENDYLEILAKKELRNHLVNYEEISKIKVGSNIQTLHPVILRRALREAIRMIYPSLKGIEQKHIDLICEVLKGKTGDAVDLPAGLRAEKSYDNLCILINNEKYMKDVEKTEQKCYHVLVYGENYIRNGMKIVMDLISCQDDAIILRLPEQILLDFDKLLTNSVKIIGSEFKEPELLVRRRESGDRISPLGMNGSKKLKEFLIDKKIPRDMRNDMEFVFIGKEVVCTFEGIISEKFKIDKTTKSILRLSVIRE